MLLSTLLLTTPASPCSPTPSDVYGVAPGLDGATDVPTDARLLLDATTAVIVELAADGQPPVPVRAEYVQNVPGYHHLGVALVPEVPLAPATEYHLEVRIHFHPPEDPPVVRASATFTTAAGPVGVVPPPVLEAIEATPWTTDGWLQWYCVLASHGVSREVTATVNVAEAPPHSWLVLRSSPSHRWPDLMVPLEAGRNEIVFPQPDEGRDVPVDRECFEPVILLANGQEIVGEPLCLAPPADTAADTGTHTGTTTDTDSGSAPAPRPPLGWGCGHAPSLPAAGIVLLVPLVLGRRRWA